MKKQFLFIFTFLLSFGVFSQASSTGSGASTSMMQQKSNGSGGKNTTMRLESGATVNHGVLTSTNGAKVAVVQTDAVNTPTGTVQATDGDHISQGIFNGSGGTVSFAGENYLTNKFGSAGVYPDSVFFKSLNDDSGVFSTVVLKPISIKKLIENATDSYSQITRADADTVIITDGSSTSKEIITASEMLKKITAGTYEAGIGIGSSYLEFFSSDSFGGGSSSLNINALQIAGTVSNGDNSTVVEVTETESKTVNTQLSAVGTVRAGAESSYLKNIDTDKVSGVYASSENVLIEVANTATSETSSLNVTPSSILGTSTVGDLQSVISSDPTFANEGTVILTRNTATNEAGIVQATSTSVNLSVSAPTGSASAFDMATSYINAEVTDGTNTSTTTVTPVTVTEQTTLSDGTFSKILIDPSESSDGSGFYYSNGTVNSRFYAMGSLAMESTDIVTGNTTSVNVNNSSLSVSSSDGSNTSILEVLPTYSTTTVTDGVGISERHQVLGLIESKVDDGTNLNTWTQTATNFDISAVNVVFDGKVKGVSDNIIVTTPTYIIQTVNEILYITYTGNVNTVWTLPAVAWNTSLRIYIINPTAFTVTINSNAGANDIWEGGLFVNTTVVPAQNSYNLYNNSLNYMNL